MKYMIKFTGFGSLYYNIIKSNWEASINDGTHFNTFSEALIGFIHMIMVENTHSTYYKDYTIIRLVETITRTTEEIN